MGQNSLRSCGESVPKLRRRQKRHFRRFIWLIPMELSQSPTCGHGRFSASNRTAERRFRLFVPFGYVRRDLKNEPSDIESPGEEVSHRDLKSKYSSQKAIEMCPMVQ